MLVVYDQIENELVIKEWRLRRSVLNFPYKLRRDDFQLFVCTGLGIYLWAMQSCTTTYLLYLFL